MVQGVVYQDGAGKITSANPAAERILGLSLEQMQGRTSVDPRWQAIHEDGSEFPGETHPAMVALETGGEIRDVMMGVLNPISGDYTWINVNAVPQFRPGEEKPFQVYTTFTDVTARRKAERALRERVKELNCLYRVLSLVEQEDAPIGQIVREVVNLIPDSWQYPEQTCARIDWVGGSSVTDGCDCASVVAEMSSEIMVDGIVVGTLTVHYTDEKPPADEGPFLEEERRLLDAVAHHLGVIMQRRQAETSLRDSEDRFRSITEHAADSIFIKDRNRRYIFVNPAMQEMLGLSEEDILGKTPEDVFGPEQAHIVRAVDDRTFAGETVNETRNLVIGDTQVFFNTIQTPLATINGEIASIMGIVRDVTRREQAERREKELHERLVRAERMEALGVLAGGIAHDLNNLLSPNVMLPVLALEDLDGVTREQCASIDSVRENLKTIQQSSRRAAETIKDLSVLSRSHVQPKASMRLNETIGRHLASPAFAELRRASPGISFHVELMGDDPWIAAAGSHVERLVSNLVRNAFHAIEGEGTVTVGTSRVSVRIPVVGYEVIEPGEYAVLRVSDTGMGIEESVLERIFEPFFTTRKKPNQAGSGLGLAVVHGIAKNHGGAIDVSTEVGKGTTFEVYFPLSQTPPERVRSGQTESDMSGGTERILVVDDEPSQVHTARQALERLGYTVTGASDGHAALSLFEEARSAGRESPFDLVVLDMLMEEGFDGLAAYREILKLYPGQKAMIASGHAGDETAEDEARRLGVTWLAKPCGREALARAVRGRLDRA